MICVVRSSPEAIRVSYTSDFRWPQKKKSKGLRSGKWGGQETSSPWSRLGMVMLDSRVQVVRLMVGNDESDALTADLTINLSSRSAEALRRPLPS
ncbi:hypothetical protein TNCV_1633411 [Trichonephila clavipes]|nr:hypothetical protein TNCV_1633411 [Trichonephila clavipes]